MIKFGSLNLWGIVDILQRFCPQVSVRIKYLITLWSATGDTRQELGFEDLLPVSIRGPAWGDGSSSQDIWWDINIITIDHTHLKWVHDSPLAPAIIVIIRCWISINEFLVAACWYWLTSGGEESSDCCDHIHYQYTVHHQRTEGKNFLIQLSINLHYWNGPPKWLSECLEITLHSRATPGG